MIGRTVLVGADLPNPGTLTAALIATILTRAAHDPVARLTHAEILGTWKVIRDADTTALRTTRCALDAKHRRARVVVDRLADSGAVSAAGGGIATVARIFDALESIGTWETGQSAAHAAGH